MPAKTTPTDPPAAAVAKDAHWSATRERLNARKRPTATLTICDDHEIKQGLAKAKFMHQRATAQAEESPDQPDTGKTVADAQAALNKAQQAFDETAVVLRFQALDRESFEALKAEHPPTEEQAEDGAEWNIDTWGPALVAASSLDGMTAEDAAHYMRTWSPNEAVELYDAAFGVQAVSRMDLGKG